MSSSRPSALRPGDKVAIVAPAGPFDRESFEAGLRRVSERYQAQHEPSLFARDRYLAGDDRRRREELQRAFDDPKVRAILTARGGYGSMRILDGLKLPRPPKIFAGFSDVTAVHALLQGQGIPSLHAPVLTQLGQQPQASVARYFEALERTDPLPALTGAEPWVEGTVEGTLVGGNLAVVSRLLGTRFLPPLDGAILLLEDVGEAPYRLDRMWTHLRLAGVFQRIRGLALGTFTRCEVPDADHTSTQVLKALAEETRLPCAFGFPVGHGELNLAVPLGVRVRLDAGAGELRFLEGAWA